MALPGFFIEYLVNGSVSLIWIWLLILLFDQQLPDTPSPFVVLLAPVLYVLGMIVDFIAKFVTDLLAESIKTRDAREKRYFQNQLRKFFWRDEPCDSSYSETVIISAYSKELATDVLLRSSRDRVARGSFVNVFIITIFFTIYCRTKGVPHVPYYAALISGLFLTCLCFFMWRQFHSLTTRYVNASLAVLAKKESGANFQKDIDEYHPT